MGYDTLFPSAVVRHCHVGYEHMLCFAQYMYVHLSTAYLYTHELHLVALMSCIAYLFAGSICMHA